MDLVGGKRQDLVVDLVAGLGVEVLLQGDAELLAQGLQLVEVLLVLALILDLSLDTWWGLA